MSSLIQNFIFTLDILLVSLHWLPVVSVLLASSSGHQNLQPEQKLFKNGSSISCPSQHLLAELMILIWSNFDQSDLAKKKLNFCILFYIWGTFLQPKQIVFQKWFFNFMPLPTSARELNADYIKRVLNTWQTKLFRNFYGT